MQHQGERKMHTYNNDEAVDEKRRWEQQRYEHAFVVEILLARKQPTNSRCLLTIILVQLLLVTLCGLTSQKTHRGGLGLSGLVHEEAHPSFPYSAWSPIKSIDDGSTNCLLVQLIPPINYSIKETILMWYHVNMNTCHSGLQDNTTDQMNRVNSRNDYVMMTAP